MGTTPTPLTIVVWSGWADHPAIVALAAKGHQIVPDDTMPDLILHPAAHRWSDAFWDEPAYLAAALKRARTAKRGHNKNVMAR